MPIAFDPPAHAPHGNVHARSLRAQDDDDASLDMFTQLLLAAANVQDPAATNEVSVRAARDDAAATSEPPFLALPLPPVIGMAAQPGKVVTILGTEGPVDARIAAAAGAGMRRGLDHGAGGDKSMTAAALSAPGAGDERTAPASTSLAASSNAHATPHAEVRSDPQALQATALPDPASDGAAGSTPKTKAQPASAATALAALLAAPMIAMPDKPAAKSTLEPVAATPQPAAPAAPAAPPATVVETVAAPAFTPGWQDETVSKLAHVVLSRNERAELRLNPAELGPVHVRVELRADQASVQIVAASAETRSALEQSLPQLRDLLASQGITLGQASVHDGAAQREARPDMWASTRVPVQDAGAGAPAESVHLVVRQPNRLVDVFA